MEPNTPRLDRERQKRSRSIDGHTRSVLEPRVIAWLDRVRGEYLEMPGLSLTEQQAQRLWGFDSAACQALLGALAQAGFLRRTESGAYVRCGNAS